MNDFPLDQTGKLTVGLFRMRKDFSSRLEKGAPGWLLAYTLKGRGCIRHAHGELTVEKGDLVLLLPETRYDYSPLGKPKHWDLLLAYFFPRTDWYALLKWPQVAPGLLRLQLAEPALRRKIERELLEVNRLYNGPLNHREMFAMNGLEKVFLNCNLLPLKTEKSGLDPRVLRAMDFLCRNLSQPVTLARLARECGMSVSRLSHLFREQVGQTPQLFLEVQRLKQARMCLELTRNSVNFIALEVGFQDPFHFSHRFKHHFGVSPKKYRENAGIFRELRPDIR